MVASGEGISRRSLGNWELERHTNVDGRLVRARLACFVLRSKRSPVEGSVHGSITKGVNLNGVCALELGEAVKAGRGCGRRKEECGEKHDERCTGLDCKE